MAKKKLLKWKVAPVPCGRYDSFYPRNWPHAHYTNEGENWAVQITCDDEYSPTDVKLGKHGVLRVSIADYSQSPCKWRRWKREFTNLTQLKEEVELFLQEHPEFWPSNKEI